MTETTPQKTPKRLRPDDVAVALFVLALGCGFAGSWLTFGLGVALIVVAVVLFGLTGLLMIGIARNG